MLDQQRVHGLQATFLWHTCRRLGLSKGSSLDSILVNKTLSKGTKHAILVLTSLMYYHKIPTKIISVTIFTFALLWRDKLGWFILNFLFCTNGLSSNGLTEAVNFKAFHSPMLNTFCKFKAILLRSCLLNAYRHWLYKWFWLGGH